MIDQDLKIRALERLAPEGVGWSMEESGTVHWPADHDGPLPSEAEIAAEMDALRAEAERITPDMVRDHADTLMIALTGARDSRHKDLLVQNGTREAVRLLRIGELNWTVEQAARAQELEALEAAIDAIRNSSNTLEAMDPIPKDFAAKKHWPKASPAP